jgi:hypothetical protein
MINFEKLIRNRLLQFMLDNVGGTELNPIVEVIDHTSHLEIKYEDGTKQLASLTVTDPDE